MSLIPITFAVFLLAFIGLGAGLWLSGRPLRGSCGGDRCGLCARRGGCPRRAAG